MWNNSNIRHSNMKRVKSYQNFKTNNYVQLKPDAYSLVCSKNKSYKNKPQYQQNTGAFSKTNGKNIKQNTPNNSITMEDNKSIYLDQENFTEASKQKIRTSYDSIFNKDSMTNKATNKKINFDNLVKDIKEESIKNNKIEAYKINFSDSVFFAKESNAARSEIYKQAAIEAYNPKYDISNKEVHHTTLDRSLYDAKFLMFLTPKTHKDLHQILDLENKIEILEYFKKTNFEHEYIEVDGVGTTYKHTFYHFLKNDKSLQEKKELVDIAINNCIISMNNLFTKELFEEIKNSSDNNRVYQKYLKALEKDKKMKKIKEKFDNIFTNISNKFRNINCFNHVNSLTKNNNEPSYEILI